LTPENIHGLSLEITISATDRPRQDQPTFDCGFAVDRELQKLNLGKNDRVARAELTQVFCDAEPEIRMYVKYVSSSRIITEINATTTKTIKLTSNPAVEFSKVVTKALHRNP
jgi:hypothetical protein